MTPDPGHFDSTEAPVEAAAGPTTNPPPRLRDVTGVARPGAFREMFFPLILAGVAGGVIMGFLGPSRVAGPLIMFASVIGVIYAVGGIGRRRRIRQLRKLAARAPGADEVVQGLVTEFRHYGPLQFNAGLLSGQRPLLASIAELLARSGLTGSAVRFDSEKPDALAPPFDTVFEPVSLNGRSAAFRTFSGVGSRSWALEYMEAAIGRSWGKLGARWILVLVMGWGFVFLAFQVIKAVLQLIGGGTPKFLVQMGVGFGILLLIGLMRLFRPRDWWLIPGGIVVRTAGWRGTEWRLHRFTQADSLVLYWTDLNQLAVANAAGQAFSRQVSRAEAEAALRAWLSALPPPPIEQLSDLT